MKLDRSHIDPDLPEGMGDLLAKVPRSQEWQTPGDYFDMLEHRIMAHIDAEVESADDDFFAKQQSEIALKRLRTTDDFQVPNHYFDYLPQRIAQRQQQAARVVRLNSTRVRVTAVLAVAASLVWAMLWVNRGNEHQPSFSELLAKESMDVEDLEYIVEGDELYDFSLEEGLWTLTDSLPPDTLHRATPTPNLAKPQPPVRKPNEKKTPSPAAPNEKKTKTKVNWDELENDDILYYLNSEGFPDDDL